MSESMYRDLEIKWEEEYLDEARGIDRENDTSYVPNSQWPESLNTATKREEAANRILNKFLNKAGLI